jgi:hypothetical protein
MTMGEFHVAIENNDRHMKRAMCNSSKYRRMTMGEFHVAIENQIIDT